MTQHHHDPSSTPEAEGSSPASYGQQTLQARIAELEQETATLREAVQSRQRIGFITGVLAQRYGLDPDQAWKLLAHVSQDLNVKVRQVTEVIFDVYCGRLDAADAALAASITRLLPSVPAPEATKPSEAVKPILTTDVTGSPQDRR